MTHFIVENNLPIAVADKCGPFSKICFHIRKLQNSINVPRLDFSYTKQSIIAPSFHVDHGKNTRKNYGGQSIGLTGVKMLMLINHPYNLANYIHTKQ
jgi:hypothetical protein